MCLAKRPQRSDAGEARSHGPTVSSQHSTTEPLRSLDPRMTVMKLYSPAIKAHFSHIELRKNAYPEHARPPILSL